MAINFSLGVSGKRYTHDMSYHVNTTSDFGSFQPILCQFLQKDDTATMKSFNQLVRNGVMPSPTFGEIKCVNNFHFVPIKDIYPAYESLLSHQAINPGSKSYIPTSAPFAPQNVLCGLFLFPEFGQLSLYSFSDPDDLILKYSPTKWSNRDILNNLKSIFGVDLNSYLSNIFGNYKPANFIENKPNSFDFVFSAVTEKEIETHNDEGTSQTIANKDLFGIRLTNAGKRLYKVFRGLGYSCDFSDTSDVSLLPLLAFYKAWFDNYYPTRNFNWQSTNCFTLIQRIFNSGISNVFSSYQTISATELIGFFKDLSDCFYTYSDDFVSAHMDAPISNVANDGNAIVNAPSSQGTSSQMTNGVSVGGQGHLPFLNTNSLSLIGIQTLTRLTKFFNKNSLIGARVRDYMRTHFGESYVNSIYGVVDNVATLITDVKLDDFYSSADTANLSAGTGEHLGARAGVGQGFSHNSFSYKTSSAGYLIGMTAIYPVSGYCQGDDGQLFMLGRYDFPVPEFDGLGYELTPKSMIFDNNGFFTKDGANYLGKSSFGFVPRYSRYKWRKSIVNGDMNLRSTSDSFQGFYLDRRIVTTDARFSEDSHGISTSFVSADIPASGIDWRFVLKYPQLGYFNRIFLNASGLYASVMHRYLRDDDNFTIQCNCNFFVTNKLKPLGMSYDTYDEDTDNSSVTIHNV